MTFYVEKSLAHGRVRFGVSPRHSLEEIDGDAALSTGQSGEFLRHRTRGFFFADTREIGSPAVPQASSLARTTFRDSLGGEGSRSLAYYALMGVGAILFLLGAAVVSRGRAAGWFEVIIGLAMIVTPIVLTAQKRRQVRAEEEKIRGQREERERREREMLDAYARALSAVRANPSEENLAAALRERQNLEVPYKVWLPLAKRTVLQIGFDALSRLGPSQAGQIADLMAHAADKVGLERADTNDVKLDLYCVVLWHLLADDRLGEAQAAQLEALRSGFGISEGSAPVEAQIAEEFHMLRGVDRESLPRKQCEIKLAFHEYCIHSTKATLFNEKGMERGTGQLYLTNKRVLVALKKPAEVELSQIDDVEVNVDTNRLTIGIARPSKPMIMAVEQPIYTAALVDIATTMVERPRGLA
ncbi:MAG TPA: hypothetical protein VLV78_00500 [Thermoanaerobaculia bacterium]|nr:hypothetical protein [Thermoanaerobaculia bacterium]